MVYYEINIPRSNVSYALYRNYFCKEKLLLSCLNSFIWYCKIVKFNIFELGIFSLNSYVYYLSRGFLASTRAFNLLTRVFNLPTRAFDLATCASSLPTHGFELMTCGFELETREFELITCGFELVTCGFELVTRNSKLVFYFSALA